MEPPFLVLRNDAGRVVLALPVDELLDLYEAAQVLMGRAVSGDPQAKAQVETLFALAADPNSSEQPSAFVSTFLIRRAHRRAEEQRRAWQAQQQAQQAQQAQQPAPPPPGEAPPAEEQQAAPSPPPPPQRAPRYQNGALVPEPMICAHGVDVDLEVCARCAPARREPPPRRAAAPPPPPQNGVRS